MATKETREYGVKLYSQKQANWCRAYEIETSFEPVMEDYEAGTMTFREAQDWNIAWFKAWAIETHGNLERSVNGYGA